MCRYTHMPLYVCPVSVHTHTINNTLSLFHLSWQRSCFGDLLGEPVCPVMPACASLPALTRGPAGPGRRSRARTGPPAPLSKGTLPLQEEVRAGFSEGEVAWLSAACRVTPWPRGHPRSPARARKQANLSRAAQPEGGSEVKQVQWDRLGAASAAPARWPRVSLIPGKGQRGSGRSTRDGARVSAAAS